MKQVYYYAAVAEALEMDNDEYDEWCAFVEMCQGRKLDPLSEARKAIQARYDAMLAE